MKGLRDAFPSGEGHRAAGKGTRQGQKKAAWVRIALFPNLRQTKPCDTTRPVIRGKYMTLDIRKKAWGDYCRKLEALGVDPYDPDLPADDSRREQVEAIVAEYEAATTDKMTLPPNWEGQPPIQPVDSLPALVDWLASQWRLVRGWELAGDKAVGAKSHNHETELGTG